MMYSRAEQTGLLFVNPDVGDGSIQLTNVKVVLRSSSHSRGGACHMSYSSAS